MMVSGPKEGRGFGFGGACGRGFETEGAWETVNVVEGRKGLGVVLCVVRESHVDRGNWT